MGAMHEEVNGVVELLTERQELNRGMRTYYVGKINGITTVVVFSRWGKVAAATTITHLILEFNITELIFTGVAGAMNSELSIGDIVIGKRFIQHDMDARPIVKKHEIPLLGITYFESSKEQLNIAQSAVRELLSGNHLKDAIEQSTLNEFGISNPSVFLGDIASGDKFFANSSDKNNLLKELPEILCVEMEGASVAQVCYEYSLPFTIIRTISDSADEKSEINFPAFIKKVSSKYSVEIIKNMYKIFTMQI